LTSPSLATEELNIAAHLKSMARREPYRLAVVSPSGRDRAGRVRYTHFTYRQLDEDSDRIAAGLRALRIGRGPRAVVMVRPGLDFFSVVFAMFKAGIVPVLIDPGIGPRYLGRCCREAEPGLFVGVPGALCAQRVLGWARETVKERIVVAPGRATGALAGVRTLDDLRRGAMAVARPGGDGEIVLAAVSSDETAAILFTSGSTGPPKGAVYTHAIFRAQVELFRSMYSIEPGEIDLCTFPLFALFAPALGMTAIIPEMDATRPGKVDPARIRQAIEDFGATNMFGSPALLRRLVQGAQDGAARFPTLKRVISAGAPVPAEVLERMASLLEFPAQIHTPYGATESLPVASIGSDEILGETRRLTETGKGVCVGRPVDCLEVKIIRISDDPIPTWSDDLVVPDGEIGELVVAGPVVTREYFNRPEETRLAKIVDTASATLYHRLGDVGYWDDRNRLWFCGRKSQRVVLDGETLFTIPCEAIFNAHPAVFRSALVGVRKSRELVPVICIETRRRLSRRQRRHLERELLERAEAFAHTRKIRRILFHPAFPVDVRHNAKIFREKLALWAAGRIS
jgi:acyl-CoA synthetase (AMP-forming)/AMP-acid ligase II